jgi:hypothetical protein
METNASAGAPVEHVEFSLIAGGPVYRLLMRARVVPPSGLSIKRLVLSYLVITWVPLTLLTILEGTFYNPALKLDFVRDLETHVRLLLALPLLLAGEAFAHEELRKPVRLLASSPLVGESERPRLQALVQWCLAFRDSVFPELLIIFLVITLGQDHWRGRALSLTGTWYLGGVSGQQLFHSGRWYAWVCIPIFQFTFYRWIVRFLVWFRFLFGLSRLDLNYEATHPDRMGGAEFITRTAYAFAPFLLAFGTLIAGVVGNHILHGQKTLAHFQKEIVLMVAFATACPIMPLMSFILPVFMARRKALAQYDELSLRYCSAFRQKWIQGDSAPPEPLLGTADIQSLADLDDAYNIIREMGASKAIRTKAIELLVLTAIPITPLILTVMPLESLAKKILALIF